MDLLDITNTSDSRVQQLKIPVKEGPTVLVPHPILSPCTLSHNFSIGANSRLEIHFSLFVTGYDPSLVDGSGPAMGIEVESGEKKVEVLDLNRLMPSVVPAPVWKTFRFSIQNQEAKDLRLVVTLSKGTRAGAAIAMDDIKVRWLAELSHEAVEDVQHQQELFPKVTDSPKNDENSEENGEGSSDETEEPKIPTTSNPHVSSANSSAIRLEERADLGSYGYTSEVVLICFCVMFGLLFLGMVGKYYQLKKNIGDYRLQQGAQQTYDNPAFSGFGMQDSYRSSR